MFELRLKKKKKRNSIICSRKTPLRNKMFTSNIVTLHGLEIY